MSTIIGKRLLLVASHFSTDDIAGKCAGPCAKDDSLTIHSGPSAAQV
jgi:hypothetical protein